VVLGRTRRRSLILAASGAAVSAAVGAPRRALAGPLSAEEVTRLDAGEVVRVHLDVDLSTGPYFGGVSYAVLQAPVARVAAVIHDPESYTSILPLTLEARVLSESGLDRKVFLRQGGRRGSAAYVLLVRRESQGLFRFWLDGSYPHDIADLWGYFRVTPWRAIPGASLLTYAALLHLDFGIVRLLFSETIRRYALGTPGVVREYVDKHRGTIATKG
jgi:hypothetical protein